MADIIPAIGAGSFPIPASSSRTPSHRLSVRRGRSACPSSCRTEFPIPCGARSPIDIVDGGPDGPEIEPWWGEPGLTESEKVFGWCNFEVLAFECGTPATPVNAIPPRAWARCQLRFVVGVDSDAGCAGAPPTSRASGPRAWSRSERSIMNVLARRGSIRSIPGCCGRLSPFRETTERQAGDLTKSRRRIAERYFRRSLEATDGLGAALISRLFAACAKRACSHSARARGAWADDRALLGFGRTEPAGEARLNRATLQRKRTILHKNKSALNERPSLSPSAGARM